MLHPNFAGSYQRGISGVLGIFCSVLALIAMREASADESGLAAAVRQLQTAAAIQGAQIAMLQVQNVKQAAQIASLVSSETSMQSKLNAQAAQISTLQNQNAGLIAQLATIQGSTQGLQAEMATYLRPIESRITYDAAHNAILFTGVNVQIENGMGNTETTNGSGNLIIGYNEVDQSAIPVCSDVTISPASWRATPPTIQGTCPDAAWGANQRQGSHNIVIGKGHSFTQYGGTSALTRVDPPPAHQR